MTVATALGGVDGFGMSCKAWSDGGDDEELHCVDEEAIE